MQLERRLERLEQDHQRNGVGPCPGCGDAPGVPRTYKVTFGDQPDDGPDTCGVCGQRLIFRVEFDDRG